MYSGLVSSIAFSQKADVITEDCESLLMSMFLFLNRVQVLTLGTIF